MAIRGIQALEADVPAGSGNHHRVVLPPELDGLADWPRRHYSPGSIGYGKNGGGASMAKSH
jgi:hypothetical protein